MNHSKLDKSILYDYLRNNLSTRQLCKKYPEIEDKTGFRSHYILKEYGLKKEDRGKLFLFRKNEAVKTITRIMQKGRGELDYLKETGRLDKYRGLCVIAPDEKRLYNLLNGELRNLIQSFFRERKRQYGVCQYSNCRNTDLDTAHRHTKSRGKLFRIAALGNKIKHTDGYVFDIFHTMTDFLNLHRGNAVIFLCKKHHIRYDATEDKNRFLEKIT